MGHQRLVPVGVLLWAIFATSSALVHPRPFIGAPSVKYFVQPLPSSSSREKSSNDIQLYSRRTVCLTTKEDPGEESNKLKFGVWESITHAIHKFKSRPSAYLLIPVIAAFVGWFTNYLAVQMIFYPIQFRGIPLWRREEIPLGLIGWQGIGR
mmetsp:Transcript_3696/g.7438  ORF Transcript_3696/g.7438 Transcript_3696/m.7438 type:complete len:152 (+) Transcript_3696:158-613(+)